MVSGSLQIHVQCFSKSISDAHMTKLEWIKTNVDNLAATWISAVHQRCMHPRARVRVPPRGAVSALARRTSSRWTMGPRRRSSIRPWKDEECWSKVSDNELRNRSASPSNTNATGVRGECGVGHVPRWICMRPPTQIATPTAFTRPHIFNTWDVHWLCSDTSVVSPPPREFGWVPVGGGKRCPVYYFNRGWTIVLVLSLEWRFWYVWCTIKCNMSFWTVDVPSAAGWGPHSTHFPNFIHPFSL